MQMKIDFLGWVGNDDTKKDFWNCYSDELFTHPLVFSGKPCCTGLKLCHLKQPAVCGSNAINWGCLQFKTKVCVMLLYRAECFYFLCL